VGFRITEFSETQGMKRAGAFRDRLSVRGVRGTALTGCFSGLECQRRRVLYRCYPQSTRWRIDAIRGPLDGVNKRF
jgi:hypothetical protein